MKILDLVKKILPIPILPQKRYIILLGTAIYFGLKAYSSYTVDPNDDAWADKFKNAILMISSNDVSQPQ